jgi:hypothetical protein
VHVSTPLPDQHKEAILLYQRRGDFEGALRLLEESGQDRAAAIATLRRSDFIAARATGILAIVLLVVGIISLALWPDARWLLFAFVALGVERVYRTVTLIRRARAL